jgi:hypothetical protein
VVPNHCPSCGGKATPSDLQRGKCACGSLLVREGPTHSTCALTNRGFYVLLGMGCVVLGPGLLVAALLIALGACWLAGVRDLSWTVYPGRLCAVLLSARVVGLFIQAFRRERWQWYGVSYVVTTYFCPGCKMPVDYSALPAFGGQSTCPSCALPLSYDAGREPSSALEPTSAVSAVCLALGPCPRCGRFDGTGGKFCTNCGKGLAGAELEKQLHTCPHCGRLDSGLLRGSCRHCGKRVYGG